MLCDNFIGIILAGGNSSRMGSPKGLLKINNTPLLIEHINALRSIQPKHIIVVTGGQHEVYESILSDIISLRRDISIIKNHNYKFGQFSSIQTGIQEAATHGRCSLLITSIDKMPSTTSTLSALVNHQISNNKLKAAIPRFNNTNGHPIVLSPEFASEVLLKSPSDRLDHIIKSLPPEHISFLDSDDSTVIQNINTPEDFSRLV